MLEENRLSTANGNYLNREGRTSCCQATTRCPPVTCHTAQCPHCHSCNHHLQPPQQHACSQRPESQPLADHTSALDEIKKAIGNVTECILNIADVVIKTKNDAEETEPAQDKHD